MRNHTYESAVIINAALEDQLIDAEVAKLKDTITQNGGTSVTVDLWGRKRLAYPIKKSKVGYYVIYRFEAPVQAIAQIERVYRLDESVLRFMNIKLTKNALEYFADQAQKAAAEALAAQALIIETDSESDNDVEVTEAAETEE
jgi:small subunit ribosomal protein S6